jgi:hypothetical protein
MNPQLGLIVYSALTAIALIFIVKAILKFFKKNK